MPPTLTPHPVQLQCWHPWSETQTPDPRTPGLQPPDPQLQDVCPTPEPTTNPPTATPQPTSTPKPTRCANPRYCGDPYTDADQHACANLYPYTDTDQYANVYSNRRSIANEANPTPTLRPSDLCVDLEPLSQSAIEVPQLINITFPSSEIGPTHCYDVVVSTSSGLSEAEEYRVKLTASGELAFDSLCNDLEEDWDGLTQRTWYRREFPVWTCNAGSGTLTASLYNTKRMGKPIDTATMTVQILAPTPTPRPTPTLPELPEHHPSKDCIVASGSGSTSYIEGELDGILL